MRPPTRSVSRDELARLLRAESPAVAARLADPSAPAPATRSFLHPLSAEGDRVRLRLAALGLVELRDAVDATEADDATLAALARAVSQEAVLVAPSDMRLATDLIAFAGQLLNLARSTAWVHCDPRVIADARALRERALPQEG